MQLWTVDWTRSRWLEKKKRPLPPLSLSPPLEMVGGTHTQENAAAGRSRAGDHRLRPKDEEEGKVI